MPDETERNLPLDPSELETTGVLEEAKRNPRVHDATTHLLERAAARRAEPDPEPPAPASEPVPRRASRATTTTALLALAAFVLGLAITVWWLRRGQAPAPAAAPTNAPGAASP